MLASGLPFTLTSCLLSTTVTPPGRHAHVAAVAVAGEALLTLITGLGVARKVKPMSSYHAPRTPRSFSPAARSRERLHDALRQTDMHHLTLKCRNSN
ncbi:hypothetical protein E2C01_030297 [Portunus trituberculatus]|uniref:Uncharacterized protein n=1 Tax=Portunus trituberculatus TaxID=210409 RepID=A0A5B7EQ29_PORTR|nr:hypothetical protein [Portunus trituberculatus]